MKRLILVPIRWYPEFFHFALRSWEECRGIENYTFRFIVGKAAEEPILDMIATAKLSKELVLCRSGSIERDVGEAMKQAALDSPDYFLFSCGDERVSRDHIELCEAIASTCQSPDLLSYSGRGIKKCKQDAFLLVKSHSFHTQGLMMFSQPFQEYVTSYLTEEYYRSEQLNPYVADAAAWFMDYFLKNFPERNMKKVPKGIDGLIDSICRKHNLYTLISVVPRVQEIGFAGGRKVGNKIGWEEMHLRPLTERIAFMSQAIDSGKLINLFGEFSEDYYENWQPDHDQGEMKIGGIEEAGVSSRLIAVTPDLQEQEND